jgi:cytochrome c553
MPRPGTNAVLAALVLSLAYSAAQASSVIPGRLLAAQCAQCHGTNGYSVGGFDSLAGETASSMFEELLEMKTDRTPDIMDIQARGYTDAQLWLIANYYASLPKREEGGDRHYDGGDYRDGEYNRDDGYSEYSRYDRYHEDD